MTGSLKTRLFALTLLLVLPASILLLIGNLKQQRAYKSLARERASTSARLAAAYQSYFVRQARQQLVTISQFPIAIGRDYPTAERGLKSLKRLQTDFDDFGLVETDGTVFCSALASNNPAVVSQELVRKTLQTRELSSQLFANDGQEAPNLQFAIPVFATNGEAVRVMYASVKGTVFQNALTNVSLPEGGAVTVFDSIGNVLARLPDANQWHGRNLADDPFFRKSVAQKEGTFEAPGLDRIERVYAASVVKDRETPVLYVTVGMPRREFFADADRDFLASSAFVLVITGLLLFAAREFSDRAFVKPIEALVGAAARITQGDLKARAALLRTHTELDRLAEAFDEMAASLERRQRELEESKLELERRVAERTSDLQYLNKELEAFSYSVSHDLRAPLRHMDGFAQMLLRDPKLQNDPQVARRLGVIVSAAKQMGNLIDDLLSFSRMGRQAISIGRVDSNRLVQEIVAETIAREPQRKIEWNIQPLPEVQGDASMLKQVWVNLISNAVKYSRNREVAAISISSEENERETIFTIQDNGAGFEMEYAGKLFGVFQRLHQASDFEGTGIGLANVRRVITRHGGRTWGEGKVNEGARFSFSIPKTA